jgi:redoxin
MTVVLWVVVGVLTAAVIFLALALMGATKTVDRLRRDLDPGSGADVLHHEMGLRVGSPAPPVAGLDAHGQPSDTAGLSGRRHAVVFADPGCGACEALVPSLLAGEAHVPLVVVAHSSEAWPDAWGTGAVEVQVIFDPEDTIGDAYVVGFTPWVFVVDEGGSVAAQGSAETVEAVRALVREADAIRIVPTEVNRGA